MTRPYWPADDIGATGPATIPVQPAEAATELGAEAAPRKLRRRHARRADGAMQMLGMVLLYATAAALLLAVLWSAR